MGLRAWHSDVAFEAVCGALVAMPTAKSVANGDGAARQAALPTGCEFLHGRVWDQSGATSTAHLFGGHLAATSGITKLLCGDGGSSQCLPVLLQR